MDIKEDNPDPRRIRRHRKRNNHQSSRLTPLKIIKTKCQTIACSHQRSSPIKNTTIYELVLGYP